MIPRGVRVPHPGLRPSLCLFIARPGLQTKYTTAKNELEKLNPLGIMGTQLRPHPLKHISKIVVFSCEGFQGAMVPRDGRGLGLAFLQTQA